MSNFLLKFYSLILIFIISFVSCKKDTEELTQPKQTLSTNVSTDINYDATMEAGKTYTIDGTIYIDGVTLTIEPGVTLKFTDNSSLVFGFHQEGAKLIAIGTPSQPIKFTSTNYYPNSGDWNNIKFTSGTGSGSTLKYCNFAFGGGLSGDNAIIDINNCSVSIENCTIEYSGNRGVDLDNLASFASFKSNTIRNCDKEAICVYANNAHTIGTNNNIEGSPILVKGNDFNQEYSKKWLFQKVPYVIEGTVNVYSAPGSKLIIDAGNTIEFKEGAKFSIGTGNTSGTLVAIGTEDSLITFTSSESTKQPGDWSGIIFAEGASHGCKIDHCVIEFGGINDYKNANIVFNKTYSNITVSNCNINYAKGYGIFVDSLSTPTLTNNTFYNNELGEIFQE